MTKNTPSTDRPNPPASRPSVILDKETARYIFRALAMTLVALLHPAGLPLNTVAFIGSS